MLKHTHTLHIISWHIASAPGTPSTRPRPTTWARAPLRRSRPHDNDNDDNNDNHDDNDTNTNNDNDNIIIIHIYIYIYIYIYIFPNNSTPHSDNLMRTLMRTPMRWSRLRSGHIGARPCIHILHWVGREHVGAVLFIFFLGAAFYDFPTFCSPFLSISESYNL